MDYKYNFNIVTDESWIKPPPIKVVTLNMDKNNKKISIKRIYIFIDNQNDKIKAELTKIENGKKPNESILNKEFGDKWRIFNIRGGDIFDDDDDIDFGVEEKVEKKEEKKEGLIKFVYDYGIYLDDSIDNIKEKIEIETKIPKIYQHICIKEKNKYKPLDYAVKYLNRLDDYYDINIFNMFNHAEDIIDFPIDLEFYNLYKKDKIQIINKSYDLFYNISKDIDTLYVLNAEESLSTDFNYATFDNIKKNNIIAYNKLFYGFVIKYWGGISNQNLFERVIRNNSNIKLSENKNTFILEGRLKNNIAKVSAPKNIKPLIVRIIITINTNLFKFINKDIIDLRVLYEYLDTNDELIYIEYGNNTKKNLKYNHLIIEKEDKNENEEKKELKLIRFKLRYQSNTYGENGIRIILNKNGIIDVQIAWKEAHNAKFSNFTNTIIPIVNNFIDRINALGNMVLIGGYKLMHITKDNLRVKYINAPIYYNFDKTNVFIDPIQLPALMKLYEPYFLMDDKNFHLNEPQQKIISSLDVRYGKIPGYNELSHKVKNQLSTNTKIVKKHAVKLKINQQENYFKISLLGIRDIIVLHNIYNFISRFINLYVHRDKLLTDIVLKKRFVNYEKFYLEKHKKYIKYSTPLSQRKSALPTYENVHEFINNKKKFNKIKLSKDVDPVLFNYDHLVKKDKKISPYSRLCQGALPPIPMCDTCIDKLNINIKPENVLRYENKTKPGQMLNYVCLDKTYKYPGFLAQNYHPHGYCLPCCKKKKFLNNKESTAYKRYIECTKQEKVQQKFNKRIYQNQKYIKGYGKIGPNRFSWLPKSLMNIFNNSWSVVNSDLQFDSNCKHKKQRIYDENCVLLYGIQQSTKSFITACEVAMKLPENTLLEHLIKKLKEKPSTFNSLETGLIKYKYKSIDNYVEYLKDESNVINEQIVSNLIRLFNPVSPKKLNIIIFNDESLSSVDENIILSNSIESTILYSNLNKKHYMTIVLIKKKLYYYPFIQNNEFIFNSESKIVRIIKHILEVNRLIILPNEITLEQIINLNLYKIEGQYVIVNSDNINVCIGVLINYKNKKFIMPVNLSPSNNLPIIKSYVYGDYNIVKEFLINFYQKVFNINIMDDLVGIINNSNPNKLELIGLMLPSKREIYINPVLISKVKLNKYVYIQSDILSINKIIKNKNVKFNSNIIHHTDIIYNNEIHNVLIIEVNNKLYNERNKSIRTNIVKYVNLPIKNYKQIDKSIKDIKNNIELIEEDLNTIREILNIVYYKKDDKMLKELMKTIRFDFDLIGIKKIKSLLRDNNNLSEKQKKIELTNIFNDIFKDIITIKNKVEYTPNVGRQNKKIINLCTDKHKNSCNKLKIEHRQQCYWDNSNCKLLMTRDDYNYHLLRFTNEIYYNETKQSDLLDIKLDNINLA